MTAAGATLAYDAIDLRPVERWLGRRRTAGVPLAPDAAREAAQPSAPGEPVRPAPAPDWSARRQEPVAFVDVYADTRDWRLHQAGYVLRLRRPVGEDAWMATLEPVVRSSGPARAASGPDRWLEGLAAVAAAATPVAQRARALAGRRPLQALFEVTFHSQAFRLDVSGAATGEIRLLACSIAFAEAAPAELRRVEVVPANGGSGVLRGIARDMAAACGLRAARLTVFEAGLLTLGLTPSSTPAPVVQPVGAESTVGQVAFAALARNFGILLANEPGTRLGDDPEELHDMRVATRRLRAAMRLFEPALPATVPRLRDELGWLAQALGNVRDLDVQLEQLAAWTAERAAALGADAEGAEADLSALAALEALLLARRAAARSRLLTVLDSRRYDRLLLRFERLLAKGPSPRSTVGRQPAVAVAPELLTRAYRRLRRSAARLEPGSPAHDFHRVRILGKRLRYALEFLVPVYGAPAQALSRRLVSVQDVLGEHQDAEVAMARLRELVAERGRRLPPATVFAMGEIAERYAVAAARQRARFPKVFKKLKGHGWRELRAAMDEARPPDRAPGPVRAQTTPARGVRRAQPQSADAEDDPPATTPGAGDGPAAESRAG